MKKLLFLIITAIIFISCEKSKEETPAAPVETFAGFRFKANGTQYEWTQPKFVFQFIKRAPNPNYFVNGGYDMESQLSINDYISFKMPIGTALNATTYNSGKIYLMLNKQEYGNPIECIITISKVDKGLCSGTFSGIVYSYPNNQQMKITEGSFTNIPVIN